MTRPTPTSTYDDDFFAWTQQQAAALRRMPAEALGNDVDIEHVAEEIEDLGKRDLREVKSFLRRLVEHLIKINGCPGSPDALHWRAEARHFCRSAAEAFSPSMRRLLDMDRIWREGRKAALEFLDDVGAPVATPSECPFDLGEVLSDAFDIDRALARAAGSEAGSRERR